MSLAITHSPDIKCYNVLFQDFRIDLNLEVKSYLKEGDELTSEKALKILKEIKWKADVKAVLTHPIFLLATSTAGLAASLALPFVAGVLPLEGVAQKVAGVAINVFAMIFGTCCGGVLGYSAINTFSNTLPRLSEGYRQLSAEAVKYIKKIESAEKDLKIIL